MISTISEALASATAFIASAAGSLLQFLYFSMMFILLFLAVGTAVLWCYNRAAHAIAARRVIKRHAGPDPAPAASFVKEVEVGN